ncbi:MAG: class I SAM-dependent methyltransferase [Chlamydiae bacterium]|nr:class I SAM-dependent methyltransferase [Chlamydiota bacterium]
MKSIGEILDLGKVFFHVLKWNFKEEKRVRDLFYKNHTFSRIDTLLKKKYRFNSPYTISKKFLQKKGEQDVHRYGETPITAVDLIAKKVGITPKDHVFELGSGRSRAAFFLAAEYRCKVSAIDWVPEFILHSYDISKRFKEIDATFYIGDITKIQLSSASVIYLYGTCLEDNQIHQIAENMKDLSSDVKIVTVSYPLTDYFPYDFKIQDQFEAEFNWGKADVFIQTPAIT